jgi:hypothetical protein
MFRTLPNGRTDVIKAMGNTKWGDIELQPQPQPVLVLMPPLL